MYPDLPHLLGSVFQCLIIGSIYARGEPVSRVQFTEDYGSQIYYAGNKTRFSCDAERGKPLPHVSWLLGPNLLERGQKRQYYWKVRVTAVLDIVLDGDMDGKALICEANNGVGTPVKASTVLEVKHSSKVIVKYDIDSNVVSCIAKGNPQKQTFLGMQLEVGNKTIPLTSTPTETSNGVWELQLNNPTLDDTGVYTCSATNGLGPPGTGSLLVQPLSAPIVMGPPESHQTPQHSNVSISFNIYSSPLVTRYSWKKNDETISSVPWEISFQETNLTMLVGYTYMELPGQYVTLKLVNASRNDTGMYTITLATSHGESSVLNFSLQVLAPEMVSTPAGPVTYKGGLGAGLIVLIVVVIVNVIVCLLCIVYWRARIRTRRKEKGKSKLAEKSRFLPEKSEAPIPPKRTTSARRVQPKRTDSTDSHYAELEFGTRNSNGNNIIRKEPPTEYAWIDFKRTALQPELSEFP